MKKTPGQGVCSRNTPEVAAEISPFSNVAPNAMHDMPPRCVYSSSADKMARQIMQIAGGYPFMRIPKNGVGRPHRRANVLEIGKGKGHGRNGRASQLDEVLLVVEVEVFILTDEFLDLIRVHVVAVNRVSIFIAGDVLHIFVVILTLAGVHFA